MCEDQNGTEGERCPDCDGTGKKQGYKYVEVGCLFSGSLLCLIGKLPNCRLAVTDKDNLKPVPFVFEGGEGIVMPCRRFDGWEESETHQ
jgi:hypothetical protein